MLVGPAEREERDGEPIEWQRRKRRAQRSAGPVTKSCGVACGDSMIVLDTPGLGTRVWTNATAALRKATQRRKPSHGERGALRLYVASCASRLNTADLEAMVAVGSPSDGPGGIVHA